MQIQLVNEMEQNAPRTSQGPFCMACRSTELRRKRDSNPRYRYQYTAFRVRPIQPLWHSSKNLSNAAKKEYAKLRRIRLQAKSSFKIDKKTPRLYHTFLIFFKKHLQLLFTLHYLCRT